MINGGGYGMARFAMRKEDCSLRAAYTGSFFHNDFTSVTFDNPFRAIDSASASSRGRLTLAPITSGPPGFW